MDDFHNKLHKPLRSGQYWTVHVHIVKDEANGCRTKKYTDAGYCRYNKTMDVWDCTDWDYWWGEEEVAKREPA